MFAPGKQILGLVSPCRCLSPQIWNLRLDVSPVISVLSWVQEKLSVCFFVPVFLVVSVAAMLFPALSTSKVKLEVPTAFWGLFYFQGMTLGQEIKKRQFCPPFFSFLQPPQHKGILRSASSIFSHFSNSTIFHSPLPISLFECLFTRIVSVGLVGWMCVHVSISHFRYVFIFASYGLLVDRHRAPPSPWRSLAFTRGAPLLPAAQLWFGEEVLTASSAQAREWRWSIHTSGSYRWKAETLMALLSLSSSSAHILRSTSALTHAQTPISSQTAIQNDLLTFPW